MLNISRSIPVRRALIKDLKVGDWVWDEINEEPAIFEGWHNGSYVLRWMSDVNAGDHSGWCAWDKDGNGMPTEFEVLRVTES